MLTPTHIWTQLFLALFFFCQLYIVSMVTTQSKNTTMLKNKLTEVVYNLAGTRSPCGNNCTRVIDGTKPSQGEPGSAIIDAEAPLRESGACVIQGHLFLKHNWYGYLAILKLVPQGGKVYFKFSYPEENCCLKMLIYLSEQVDHLRAPMNCLQKQAILDPKSPQVITLSPSSKHSGCKTVIDDEGKRMLECKSGRILKSDVVREWYIAASNCGSPSGLDFDYSLIVLGNLGECPERTTDSSSVVKYHLLIYLLSVLITSFNLL